MHEKTDTSSWFGKQEPEAGKTRKWCSFEYTIFQRIKKVYRLYLFATSFLHFHASFAMFWYSRGSLFFEYTIPSRNDGKTDDKREQENRSDTAEN